MSDNPALTSAVQAGDVLPIYILDDDNAGMHALGGASRWWLHHSLTALNTSLGGNLSVYRGDPAIILNEIIVRHDVSGVYWNRCYEPWRTMRDAAIKASLKAKGIEAHSSNGSLLWEPWQVQKGDGTPYKVFTPFYRKGCLNVAPPREPIPAPQGSYVYDAAGSVMLEKLDLLPGISWDKPLEKCWKIGEAAALQCFETFIDEGITDYKEGRNFPSKPFVSRLSPYLHFGEISPNQLWYGLRGLFDNAQVDHFCSELGWREFSHSQLFYNPDLPTKNLQPKFDQFPWIDDADLLMLWQKGQTGIPMVDAGMRELWQTGYMHNRVRMIVGSFLVKNLRLHWHHGERWFWDTLVDADMANNSAGWQWIAGCGADAAPYFRVFNPVTQGQKFDPDGEYIRKYIPEISSLPNKYLFNPWDTPKQILKLCDVVLGDTYPNPIVDLKISRQEALDGFQFMKKMLEIHSK